MRIGEGRGKEKESKLMKEAAMQIEGNLLDTDTA